MLLTLHPIWINFWRLNLQNTIFKNNFFPKLSKKIKKFLKKISKIFLKKFYVRKRIFYFQRFWGLFFENKIFENWSLAVRIWLFFDTLQKLKTRICVIQKKYLMPFKDSTHQRLWPEIQSVKIWRQTFEILQIKKK